MIGSNLSSKMILSIQSHVAYGHAGNSAAVFPLQRLGFEVLPVHTVQFSNHTGHGSFRGEVFTAEHIHAVIDGMAENHVLEHVDAVLSGYLGDSSIGQAILDAVDKVRALNPQMVYVCDPVMGDMDCGLFVNDNIPDFMRQKAVPQATIISPNQYEFELIAKTKLTCVQDAIVTARGLMQQTCLKTVLITSLKTPDISQASLATLAVTHDQAWLVTTPIVHIAPSPSGMGDVFASVFLGRILQGMAVHEALEKAGATLYGLLSHIEPKSLDLPLIAQQDQIVSPTHHFQAQQVS